MLAVQLLMETWAAVVLPVSALLTDQPKWDTFGRLLQPLLSRVPLIHTDGNHEVRAKPPGWTLRWTPAPLIGGHSSHAQLQVSMYSALHCKL